MILRTKADGGGEKEDGMMVMINGVEKECQDIETL